MKVAIVKYNAGNIQSVKFALSRLGVEQPILTDDPEEIRSADKVIFPGQGEASTAMKSLNEAGLVAVLKNLNQPFLGVCLGMQLMCEYTEENNTKCIGIIPETVKKFNPSSDMKVPHMGWNNIYDLKSPIFSGVADEEYIYFVHSYYVPKCDHTIAECDYLLPFSAAIQKDNYFAVQAHPEKSADTGMKILENFLKL
ncbi:imidazole glycerol phosphate synthase subunit HisH [Marinoscillum sp. MHG1-6]|uniref:imidazole glycerol phosphate synthase subunit HisH n=1 Tax=Marinoscillum sp. MHG1-6 TaxID=2959627 RepID=UPI00215747B0|nr:imidazole glycerol phosphate synthase subunit HisH [Marinoscillum sp. MHG1-6]